MKHKYVLFTRKNTKGKKVWSFYYWRGSKRIVRSTGKTVKWQAEQEAEKFFKDRAGSNATLKEFTKDFFVWGRCRWIEKQHKRDHSFSPSVAKQRRSHLDNYILPKWGDYLLRELHEPDIDDWLLSLNTADKISESNEEKRPLSNQTKNHILFTFRIVMREAENRGFIDHSPVDKVKPLGEKRKKRDIFTLEDLRLLFPDEDNKLLHIWRSWKHAALYCILAGTGIRSGEVRALQIQHIRPDRWIVINQAVKDDGTVGTTKTKTDRVVYLPPKAWQLLRTWLAELPFKDQEDYIFIGNQRGRPISKRTVSMYFHGVLERAEIKIEGRNLVPHSFRHTWNTYMRRLLPEETLRAYTGHQSEQMTDNYDHPTVDDRIKKLSGTQKLIEKGLSF